MGFPTNACLGSGTLLGVAPRLCSGDAWSSDSFGSGTRRIVPPVVHEPLRSVTFPAGAGVVEFVEGNTPPEGMGPSGLIEHVLLGQPSSEARPQEGCNSGGSSQMLPDLCMRPLCLV